MTTHDPFDYIRNSYGVPAYKGARVEYTGNGYPEAGTVTKADGAHIMVKLDGAKKESGPYHPTWEMRYMEVGK